MGDNKVNVFTPGKGDAMSVRKIQSTKEDRAKDLKEFREDRAEKDRVKKERFANIEARRKNKPGSGGSGGGINIEVTSDTKK